MTAADDPALEFKAAYNKLRLSDGRAGQAALSVSAVASDFQGPKIIPPPAAAQAFAGTLGQYRTVDHVVGFDCIRRDRMKKWCPMMASVTASPRCLGARMKVFPRKLQYDTRYLAMIPCRMNDRNRAT